MTLELFAKIVGIGSLIGQISIIPLLFLLFGKKNINIKEKYLLLLISFIIFLSIIGSLLFSDYFMKEPCNLCWLQRVLLFPQILLIFLSFIKKKTSLLYDELTLFSFLGFFLALYQSIGQQKATLSSFSCGIDSSPSCNTIHMLSFGYITFPVASATVFALIFFLSLLAKKTRKNSLFEAKKREQQGKPQGF